MIDTTLSYIDKKGIERPLILKYYYSRIEQKNHIYDKISCDINLQSYKPCNDNISVNDDIKYINYESMDIYPIKTTGNKFHKSGIIDWIFQCTIL